MIKKLFFCLQILLFIAMISVYLNQIIPIKVFPYFNFLALFFPIFLIFYLFFTLTWVFISKRNFLIFLALSFFFISPVRTFLNFSPKKLPEKQSLKVISLNSRNLQFLPNSKENFKEFIEKENPDVLFLQEQFITRKKELPADFKFFKYSTFSLGKNEFFHIFSKYPLSNFQTEYKGNACELCVGNIITADMDYQGQRVKLVNIYSEPFKLSPTQKQIGNLNENLIPTFTEIFSYHEIELTQIISKIQKEEKNTPIIIGGDLNNVPLSREYFLLTQHFTDSFRQKGRGVGFTFWDIFLPLKIDYLFCSKEITPLDSYIYSEKKISDHFPIISIFEIQ